MRAAAPPAAQPDRVATWEEVCQATVVDPAQLAALPRIHSLVFEGQNSVGTWAQLSAEDMEFLYHLGERTEELLN